MEKPEKVEKLINKINDGISNHKEGFLIGLIEADYDSYCELMEYAGALINKSAYALRAEKELILSIALVLFAIKEFRNVQFWNEFAARLDIDEYDAMKIGKKSFENFCKKNVLYFHVGNKNKGYVTSILTHAILPNVSMEKFFTFLHDLYFRDLEENYIELEVEELIQYMRRLFSKYLEDDDISLVVQGTKMTIANQHLPKAFRIAFTKAASVVTPIFKRMLFYINQLNYSYAIEYLENDRFDISFEQYSYIIKDSFEKSASRKRCIEQIKKFQTAQYYYEREKLYLQVPKQIIDSDYIETEIFLEVLGHGTVIHQEKVFLTKSRLFFKSEEAEIFLSEFYSDLKFRLVSDYKTIYSSGDVLNREFIIFDIEGNEVRSRNLKNDTVKVITNSRTEISSENALMETSYVANYRISTVFLNEESLLLIDNKALSMNGTSIRNEMCAKKKYCGVIIKDSNKNIFDVYSENPEIRLRIPYKKTVQNFIISLNDKNYQMEDVAAYELKLVEDGSGDKLGIFRIDDSIIKDNIPAHVVIREKGSNKRELDKRIFILKSLSYEFDQKYYYKENVANMIKIEAENVEFLCVSFPQKVNLRLENSFKIKFVYNTVIYQMILEIPVLRWRFGDLHSASNRYDEIWWEEIKEQKLYIKFPNQFLSQLHIITGTKYEMIQGEKHEDEYRFSIKHVFQIKNQDPVTFGVLINGNEERITEIHFKPFIKDFSVSYYDKNSLIKGIYAQWKYIGSGNLYVDILYTLTGNVIKQYLIKDSNHLMDRDIELHYNEYDIEIYQLNEDDFFGGCTEKNVLVHESFIVGDAVIVCTKNKILKGKNCVSGEEKYELSNFYLKDIRFSRKMGFYEATGMYFVRDKFTGKEREWYFTNYNPFILKLIYLKQGKLIFEILDKDEDGLIYDVKNKYVNPKEEKRYRQNYKVIDTVELEIVK